MEAPDQVRIEELNSQTRSYIVKEEGTEHKENVGKKEAKGGELEPDFCSRFGGWKPLIRYELKS